jgi:hypothetical protein
MVEKALLQSTRVHRALLTSEEQSIQEFGQAHFDALIGHTSSSASPRRRRKGDSKRFSRIDPSQGQATAAP